MLCPKARFQCLALKGQLVGQNVDLRARHASLSASRNDGAAISINALALASSDRPFSSATPNSVTTRSISVRAAVVALPGAISETILEISPAFAVAANATIEIPTF